MDDQLQPGQLLARGVCRHLRSHDFVCVEELVPTSGLRVDVMALGPKGEVWVIECKSSRASGQGGSVIRVAEPVVSGLRRWGRDVGAATFGAATLGPQRGAGFAAEITFDLPTRLTKPTTNESSRIRCSRLKFFAYEHSARCCFTFGDVICHAQ